MLQPRRLLAAQVHLLAVGALLCGALVFPSLAGASGPSQLKAASSATKPASSEKSKSPKRAKCAVKIYRGKHRKPSKSCVVKKSRAGMPTQASRNAAGPESPLSLAASFTSAPADATLGIQTSVHDGLPSDGVSQESSSQPESSSEPPEDTSTSQVEAPPTETPVVETPPAERAATTTSLASLTNPSTVGQTTTYTATLNTSAATGTVEFVDGSAAIPGCAAQTVSSGSAICTLPGYATAASHSITAVYSGDGSFLGSTSSALTQTVSQAATTISLSSGSNPSTVGQTLIYTATLNAVATTGTVTFKDGGNAITTCASRTVSAGTATCTIASYTTAGSHIITATYNGDSSYLTSTSPTLSEVVAKAPTTTTVYSETNTALVGQSVTYNATLSSAAATGTVEFKDGETAIAGCNAVTPHGGGATCVVASYATAGAQSITATYSGDGNYLASISSPLIQTINQASTTTTLSSSVSPPTVGEAVTYTATVSPAAASGAVEFKDAGVTIVGCADQTVAFGTATCSVTGYPAASSHSITATYGGDSNYLTSTSSALTEAIGQASTTTTLSSGSNPSTAGQVVIYTATLNTTNATGSVTFRDAGNTITQCAAQTVSAGSATCTITGYAAGSHSISAVYNGDSNYLPSTSSVLTQSVNKGVITTTVYSEGNPSLVGHAVTYNATVGSTAATGTIEFKDSGVAIPGCNKQPLTSGSATCIPASYTTAGSNSITAAYSGDSSYLPSTSSPLTQTVDPAGTTTSVSSGTNPLNVGQAVTYTATISTTNATGTIAFSDSGTQIPGCTAQTVTAGSATCTLAGYATAGEHMITATYSGDANYTASTSSPLNQAVSLAITTTTTTLSSSASPSSVGQSVTYTATVNATLATGTIEFKDSGAAMTACDAQMLAFGSATCTVTIYPTPSTHSITATYSGDGNYLTSTSSPLIQRINQASTSITLASSSNPSTVGQATTYTANISPASATGTVEFREEGIPIDGCTAQIVNLGGAECSVASYTGAGSRAITVVYSGDANDSGSVSTTLTQTVNRATSTITVSSSADPSTTGQAVTYTATVSPSAATGTITFKEAGTAITGCSAQTVSSGIAICVVPSYGTASSNAITATYSGDSNYLTSTSSTLTETVNQASTTTTLSSSMNPSTVGQSVIYTAKLNTNTAPGTVAFKDGAVAITGCTAQTVSSGSATCTITGYTGAGSHTITAVYSGDANYAGSTSPLLTQTVSKTTTTIGVSSETNPGTVGQAETYTAKLNATAATGTIEFKDNGTTIASCATQAVIVGSATCAVPVYTAAGPHSIIASYRGDNNYLTSSSTALTQTVNQATTTTTVSSGKNPSQIGQAVIYTATVNSTAATGTVEFRDAGAVVTGCNHQAVSLGSATCMVTGYTATGTHAITATYSGDTNYLTSTSSTLTQTVSKASTTTTTVSSGNNPSKVGQAVTYTAKLNTTAATGTIEFKEAGTAIPGCVAQTVSSGTATCTVAGYTGTATQAISATYTGDSNYLASTSPTLTQTVNKAPTNTTLVSSATPSTVGQAVTYTATVSPAMTTGTIEFKEAGTAIPGCNTQTISANSATCTVANPAAGTHSITATYSGGSNYATSTSPGLTQVVHKIATTTTLSSQTNPSKIGQAVTYTATLNTTTATGTIEFKDAGAAITGCTAVALTSGRATCSVASYTTAASHWITASYSGDNNYLTSTFSGLTQTVNKAPTNTTLVSSATPSTVGQAVTYTATVSPAMTTGTIEFKEAGTAIPGCNTQTISANSATCTVANPAAGTHSITATYSGGSNYATSTSPGLTQVVHKIATTTTLSSQTNPSKIGQAVTYTATLNTTTATGTIEFKDAGAAITGCTAVALTSGRATCSVASYTTAASHWITASYSGDNNYLTSTFSGLTQTVNKAPTNTTLVSSATPSTVGQAVTYTATVSPAMTTGTIEFKEAGTAIPGCNTQTISANSATCTVANYPSAAWYRITATYSGDSNYSASTSPVLTQVVNVATTATTIASSVNPSTVGQAVTYTATLNTTAATGTVEFTDGGVPIVGCTAQTVSTGKATCAATGYPTWSSYVIVAIYGGDSNYRSSVSSTLTQTVEPPPAGPGRPYRPFSPTSFWNEQVPASAPLDPSSAAVVDTFDKEIVSEEEAKKGQANVNTTEWSIPVYTVLGSQPTVIVHLVGNQSGHAALQSAWDAVPLPPSAKPAAGTDEHLVVSQPSTDRLWEFWGLEKTTEGDWQAKWGGAIEKASSNPGSYGPEAWAGATTGWGASASSLSIAGGLITLEDLELGQINHALAMSLPDIRAGVYASPAKRTDGGDDEPLSLPEGARLRLDPSLDLATLHLPRLALMMAEAAQQYGIIVRDTASNVAFYGQDPTPLGTNPYVGAHGYYEGKTSQQILESFPWSHLELLKMNLHSES